MMVGRSLWACMLFLGVATCPSPGFGAPLSPADQALFRDAHAARPGGTEASNRLLGEANERARRLAIEKNGDAIPFLLALGDRSLLMSFAGSYFAPTTPAVESLVLQYLRDPGLSPCMAALLVRNYRSRALYEALRAAIREKIEQHNLCGRAIVLTDLPGIEADLTELLPGVDRYDPGSHIAQFLVRRRYLPAEPALIDWLNRAPPRGIGTAAWIVVNLESPGMVAALARRVAAMGGQPDSGEFEQELDSILAAMKQVTPGIALDRAILADRVIATFPAPAQAKIQAALAERYAIEQKAQSATPDNLAYFIAQRKNVEVRKFIAQGVALETLDKSRGSRPLHTAIGYGNLEALKMLLEAGADPDSKDWMGYTALRLLSSSKASMDELDVPKLEAAKLLFDHKANPSLPSDDTMTPLHVAAAVNFKAMVQLLVERGADVNAEAGELRIKGLTPTLVADDQGNKEIAAYLRAHGGKVNYAFVAKRGAHRAMVYTLTPFLHQH